MKKLIRLAQKFAEVPLEISKEINEIANSPEMVFWSKVKNQEQLQKGTRSDGTTLPNYSETSVKVFNKPPGPIRLFDSGNFYLSFTIETKPDSIWWVATRPIKYGWEMLGTNLLEKYGEYIMGLTEANKQLYIEKMKEKLIPKIKEILETLRY